MTDERRSFLRRATNTRAAVETMSGQLLDEAAGVINLSIAGARIASRAELVAGAHYRLRLEGTNTWFEISVQERIDGEYRCKIETPWDDLHDVIRQSDDLTLLVLESTDPEEEDDSR